MNSKLRITLKYHVMKVRWLGIVCVNNSNVDSDLLLSCYMVADLEKNLSNAKMFIVIDEKNYTCKSCIVSFLAQVTFMFPI
jgi:hypothetical protein